MVRSSLVSDTHGVTGIPDEAAFRRILRRSTLTLLASLLIPLVFSLGLVLYLLHSARQVEHTDRVIAAITDAQRGLVTMQSAFRGYRLMGDESLMDPFAISRQAVNSRVAELQRLIVSNPAQAARIAEFDRLGTAWVAEVDAAMTRLRAGATAEKELGAMLEARRLITAALALAAEFSAEEERVRFLRQQRLDAVVALMLASFGLYAVVGIPALAWWLHRLLQRIGEVYRSSLGAAERCAAELRVTLNSIGDAVVATDTNGRVEFINPVAAALMGWSPAEAQGHPLTEVFQIFHEETGEPALNPVGRVLRENVVVGLANHTVLRSRDGRERPIEDSAAPIRGEDGVVRGVILVFHDVGARRELTRLLEQSERRLSLLNNFSEATRALNEPAEIMGVATRLLGEHLNASRCAYAEVEDDGEHFTVHQDFVDGCAQTTGRYPTVVFGAYAAAELRAGRTMVLRDVAQELSEESGGAAFRAVEAAAVICRPLIKLGRLRGLVAVHQTAPRAWKPAEIKLVEEFAERSWAAVERARAEAAVREARANAEAAAQHLAESAERFRLIAGVVSMQVWTARLNGEIDYANQECAQYFGVDVERGFLGNAWVQFVHPDDLPAALEGWLAALSSGRRFQTEFRLRDRVGNYRWFLVRAVAMRDSHGQVAKWFGTNTDIDDLKRAQAEALRASRAKDDFIAALSHELRTPLTPVLLTAATLKDDARLPGDVREQLGMMERNIALEARLIDDLLDLTTIARGKLHLRAAPVDAHSLIGLAVEIVRDDARAKEITIARELGAVRSGLNADPARFQQVIWNLLRNAVKFTPRGGRITIRTQETEVETGRPRLQIVVADSGIGIEAEMLEKIFRPFDQGGLMGDHRFGGVGLGLAIARAVVDLHGGRISAHSEGANRGATFTVDFPGAVPAPLGASDSAPLLRSGSTPSFPLNPAAGPRRSLALLLVEDHDATLQVLLRLLTREGHTVVPAASVQAALAAAESGKFDLVISDLGLPDGTGAELMEKVRANYGLRGIALSGYGMEEDLVRSQQAGFIAHLIKPVDFAQLKRLLETLE